MKNIFIIVCVYLALLLVNCNSTSSSSEKKADSLNLAPNVSVTGGVNDSTSQLQTDPLPLTELLELKWKIRVSNNYTYSPPVLKDNNLYVLTSENIVVLDPITGNLKKELPLAGSGATPLDILVTDSIILLHGEKALIALSLNDGKMLWQYPLEWASSSPFLFGDYVYIADGKILYSINIASGKKAWSFKATINDLHEAITIQDKTAFISADSNLYALNILTGKELWKTYLGYSVASQPKIEGNILYILTSGGVYAIDVKSHKVVWTSPFDEKSYGTLFVNGDSLYICEKQLHCINRINGRHVWSSDLHSFANNASVMLDKYLFFNQTDRGSVPTLTVFDKSFGKEAYRHWGTDLDEVELNFGSTILGNTIFASGSNGWVYAFKLKGYK